MGTYRIVEASGQITVVPKGQQFTAHTAGSLELLSGDAAPVVLHNCVMPEDQILILCGVVTHNGDVIYTK
jgi:hypothetical protein